MEPDFTQQMIVEEFRQAMEQDLSPIPTALGMNEHDDIVAIAAIRDMDEYGPQVQVATMLRVLIQAEATRWFVLMDAVFRVFDTPEGFEPGDDLMETQHELIESLSEEDQQIENDPRARHVLVLTEARDGEVGEFYYPYSIGDRGDIVMHERLGFGGLDIKSGSWIPRMMQMAWAREEPFDDDFDWNHVAQLCQMAGVTGYFREEEEGEGGMDTIG